MVLKKVKMKLLLKLGIVILVTLIGCEKSKDKIESQPISLYLYGQNLWLTQGAEGRPGYIQEKLWQKVKESGAKIIRIGGNGYEHKMPSIDTLDMWVKSIKSIGAEPLFQVSRLESAERAAELVRHFNNNDSLKIKYWSIGNEPYGMAKWSIDTISNIIKSYSSAMKSVDPKIKIFIPDAATYYNDLYKTLLLSDDKGVAGRDAKGNWYIDGVSFHTYPNGKNYTRKDVVFNSVDKIRGQIIQLKQDIDASNLKYNRIGDSKLIWGITEFNITYSNPDDLNVDGFAVPSFINGQFWVDIFGLAIEYDAFCVTPWCIQESDVAKTYFGYIGGPPEFTLHSTYYHMQMMSENIKGNFIKMYTNNGFIKAIASQTETETALFLMNQHETELFNFDLKEINKISDGLSIYPLKPINLNFKGSVEPNSSMVLVFNKQGSIIKKVVYTIEMTKNNKPPLVYEY